MTPSALSVVAAWVGTLSLFGALLYVARANRDLRRALARSVELHVTRVDPRCERCGVRRRPRLCVPCYDELLLGGEVVVEEEPDETVDDLDVAPEAEGP